MGEVCLHDPRTKQNYRQTETSVIAQDLSIQRKDKDIEIHPQGPETTIVSRQLADENGCVQFTYELPHKHYNSQKYYMKKLTFKVDNMEGHKYIALNPWEYGFLTYQDFTHAYKNWTLIKNIWNNCQNRNINTQIPARSNVSDSCQEEKENYEKSRETLAAIVFSENIFPPVLRMNDYRNTIIEPSYLVEPSLDIQTLKNIQLLLHPTIVRRDSPGETIRHNPTILPIGYYLVRVIVAKGPQEVEDGKQSIIERYLATSRPDPLQTFNPLKTLWRNMVESYTDFYGVPRISTDTLDAIENNPIISHDTNPQQHHLQYKAAEKRKAQYQTELYEKYQNQYNQLLNLPRQLIEEQVKAYQDLEKENNRLRNNITYPNALGFTDDGCHNNSRVPCFKKEDYITHADTLAYSENGVITAFMQLGFNIEHFRLLGSKNSILIEIYPTDPEGYKYLHNNTGEYGGQCQMDIKQSVFKPYPSCDNPNQNEKEECHDLRIPTHWGLFFSSEFGNANIVWPTYRNYSQVFDIPEVQTVQGKEHSRLQSKLSIEKRQMELMEKSLAQSSSEESLEIINQAADTAYENHFSQYVNSLSDTVDSYSFHPYCQNMKKQMGQLAQNQSKEINIPENLLLSMFICNYTMAKDELKLVSGSGFIKNKIKQYFITRELMNSVHIEKDPERQERPVQIQAGGFCPERNHSTYRTTRKESDYSSGQVDYQDCVCSSPNNTSVTKKMANCFAKDQGVIFVKNNEVFFQELQRDSGLEWDNSQLSAFTQQTTEPPTEKYHSLLKAMCHFWFKSYYTEYMTLEHIENIYNNTIPFLELLHNPETIDENLPQLDEESRFSNVNFNDFKNVQSSSSKIAQYLQSLYEQDSFYPFSRNVTSTNRNYPYYKCLNKPLAFFHTERKIMVDQINTQSNKMQYKNGHVYSLTTQASQGASLRVEIAKRHQFGIGSRGEFKGSAGIPDKVPINASYTLGASSNIEWARADAANVGDQITVDATKSILLAVNQIEIDLALNKYRSCLLIRPKGTAFTHVKNTAWMDRFQTESFWGDEFSNNEKLLLRIPFTDSGLLICSDEENKELVVPEKYYYIHQFFGGHAYEFMSRTIYHNRPYTEIIRGQEQMSRFVSITRNKVYDPDRGKEEPWDFNERAQHLHSDRNNMDYNLIEPFEDRSIDFSGFYKGVYTFPDLINYDSKIKSSSLWSSAIDQGAEIWKIDENETNIHPNEAPEE